MITTRGKEGNHRLHRLHRFFFFLFFPIFPPSQLPIFPLFVFLRVPSRFIFIAACHDASLARRRIEIIATENTEVTQHSLLTLLTSLTYFHSRRIFSLG
jgi:hypothetical protein